MTYRLYRAGKRVGSVGGGRKEWSEKGKARREWVGKGQVTMPMRSNDRSNMDNAITRRMITEIND